MTCHMEYESQHIMSAEGGIVNSKLPGSQSRLHLRVSAKACVSDIPQA